MIKELEIESWSLDIAMAKMLLPKLLYFKNWCDRYGCPIDLEIDEWEEVLDSIIWSFTYISKEYPKHTDYIVCDTKIVFDKKSDNGFVKSTIELVFEEGKTEEDYKTALVKDQQDLAKCQQGLNLFGKYYMSIWN